jgi:hypothetical protein
MTITRDNYELWFLDYLEGNLDEKMVDDFLEFLRENPDLSEELHLFESVGLTKSDLVFSDKKKLYKECFDLPDVFDSTATGLLEGDLDTDEQVRFSNFLTHHPEKNKELQLFKLTKLTPELTVFFKNKQRLYRQPVIRLFASRIVRIAAVFVFIFALSQVTEKQFSDMNSVNSLIILTSNNQTTLLAHKKDFGITNPGADRLDTAGDQPYNVPGKKYLPVKKPESTTLSALQSVLDTVREFHSPLIAALNSSPVYEIKFTEPELMTTAIFYEMASLDEPANVSLSHRFFQKIGLSGLNPGKMVRWGLSLAANLTKEKFNYATDSSGEIVALNLDTRLVGLSIPVNRKQ